MRYIKSLLFRNKIQGQNCCTKHTYQNYVVKTVEGLGSIMNHLQLRKISAILQTLISDAHANSTAVLDPLGSDLL